MIYKRDKFEEMYIDYFNNFLTKEKFASYYNITLSTAIRIINKGRDLNRIRCNKGK